MADELVTLVDMEQMYGPGLNRPEYLAAGSPGYAHLTAGEGLWGSNADRLAGVILLSEMLGWCDLRVCQESWGESYLDPAEMQQDCGRYQVLAGVVKERWGDGPAGLLERAWKSETLADCPTFGEWLVMLSDLLSAVRPKAHASIDRPRPETVVSDHDSVQTLIDVAEKFEQQKKFESALEVYQPYAYDGFTRGGIGPDQQLYQRPGGGLCRDKWPKAFCAEGEYCVPARASPARRL